MIFDTLQKARLTPAAERYLESMGIPLKENQFDIRCGREDEGEGDFVYLSPVVGPGQRSSVIRVPMVLGDGKWIVYWHRFINVDPAAPQALADQLSAGYIGITKRGFAVRWNEHIATAYSGGGFALHRAINACLVNDWRYSAISTIVSRSDTLPVAYAREEELVARYTLAPRGLNVIPGGYAGLRFLVERGLSNNRRLSPEQRDTILTDVERRGPEAHYRQGHVRRLAARTTWVKACFVNLNADLVDMEVA